MRTPGQWTGLLQALDEGSELQRVDRRHRPRTDADFTAEWNQARIGRDGEDWPDSPLLLIADVPALTFAQFPLLAVNNLPAEDDAPFRITLAAAGSFVVNIELVNTGFGDWGPWCRRRRHLPGRAL
ncbi:DUF6924 domain-containing protein [Streptomyces sp. NBC_00388]|uniref:DUF6924 domain-containing protein n=1 Tax=Streptomyces sp. NBC_00388 TaxID=2975735 RepID=UPI003FA7A7BA